MDIGVLQIQMMADLAQLKRDMDDAKTTVGSAMVDIQKSIDFAKNALISLTGIASVDAFKGMIESSLKGVASLHELSIQTGATVESLSALAAVGKMTGTSADDISGMMNKLAKNMLMANDESKGTGAAISALGLNLKDFQALSPDEKMTALAGAMNNFQDGSEKSAVAMQLLGKTGAQALPFLKDLAETQSLQAKVTTEQAAQAEEFELSLIHI